MLASPLTVSGLVFNQCAEKPKGKLKKYIQRLRYQTWFSGEVIFLLGR